MSTVSEWPLVSIITVTFNSAATVADTLKSVGSQSYPNIEHVIIDGLSHDRTIEIVNLFPHVKKVVSEKDKGIYDAMNKGLQLAQGEIIGILNSDDFYTHDHVVRHVVEKMQQEKTDALYADLVYVHPDNTNKIVRSWKSGAFNPRNFLFGWMPPHPTFFVRKGIYQRYGTFHTRLRSAADYELMLRFLYKHKVSVSYLPEIIVKMRSGGNSNISFANRLRANKEDREAWRMNSLVPYFFTSLLKPVRKIYQFFHRSPITDH